MSSYEGTFLFEEDRNKRVGRTIYFLDSEGKSSNLQLTEEVSFNFSKHEGKSKVDSKRSVGVGDRFSQSLRGERHKENLNENYNYIMADPVARFCYTFFAQMTTAYGNRFDLPLPLETDLSEDQKNFIHFLESSWKDFVGFNQQQVIATFNLFAFGNYYAEIVFDDDSFEDGGWGIYKIKHIDPRTIYADRDESGRYVAYYQHPKALQIQPRSIKKSKLSTKLHPRQIIHIKLDDFLNSTYGISKTFSILDSIDMKVGAKGDTASIIKNRASPFLVWSIGSENMILSSKVLKEVYDLIDAQLGSNTDSDVFVPGLVKVEAVGTDGSDDAKNILPFIEFMNDEIGAVLGLPDILVGKSTASGESASAKIEAFTRVLKNWQQFLATEFRNKLFCYFIKEPFVAIRNENTNNVRRSFFDTYYISPKDYAEVPVIIPNTIESVADMRLRIGEMLDRGAMGVSEARNQTNIRGKIKDDDLNAENKKRLEESKNTAKNDPTSSFQQQEKLRPPSSKNPTKTATK